MIQELITNKEKYFWSRSAINNNIIIVGGYENGMFFGMIEFVFNETSIAIRKQISKGVSYSEHLPEKIIEKDNEPELFDSIQIFSLALDAYLASPDTKAYYLTNRRELLENTFNLLQTHNLIFGK